MREQRWSMVNNFYGLTAHMYACKRGHHECAQALIDAGAAVDIVNNGWTALMYACNYDHHECAQALIDEGAAVDEVNNDGKTALMCACSSGHVACIRILIEAQADLELTDRYGRNALMIACESPPSNCSQSQRQGRIRYAFALLEATAPIREPDSRDRAASLKFACGLLELIATVLAMQHAIEDAPPLTNAGALQTDAQGNIVSFGGDTPAIAQLPKPRLSRRLAAERSLR